MKPKQFDNRKGRSRHKSDKVNSPSHKPLRGRIIFLHLHGYRGANKFEEDIKLLGATVEKCFSREVHILITSQGSVQDYERHRSKPGAATSAASPATPSPFNLASLKGVDSPQPDSPGEQATIKPLTRGQKIALQAKKTHNRGSADVVENAKLWKIKTIHIDQAQKYVQRELEKIPAASQDENSSKRDQKESKSKHKIKRLHDNYIKFESSTLKYRPLTQTFKNFPTINTKNPVGCPFELPRKDDGSLLPDRDLDRAEREELDKNEDSADLRQLEDGGTGGTAGTADLKSPPNEVKQESNIKQTNQTKTYQRQKSLKQRTLPSSGYSPSKLYTRGELRRIMLEKIRAEQKKGYCEACQVKYDDIDKHVRNEQHMKFARDKGNYLQLDDLIEKGPNMEQFLNDVMTYHKLHKMEAGDEFTCGDEVLLMTSPALHLLRNQVQNINSPSKTRRSVPKPLKAVRKLTLATELFMDKSERSCPRKKGTDEIVTLINEDIKPLDQENVDANLVKDIQECDVVADSKLESLIKVVKNTDSRSDRMQREFKSLLDSQYTLVVESPRRKRTSSFSSAPLNKRNLAKSRRCSTKDAIIPVASTSNLAATALINIDISCDSASIANDSGEANELKSPQNCDTRQHSRELHKRNQYCRASNAGEFAAFDSSNSQAKPENLLHLAQTGENNVEPDTDKSHRSKGEALVEDPTDTQPRDLLDVENDQESSNTYGNLSPKKPNGSTEHSVGCKDGTKTPSPGKYSQENELSPWDRRPNHLMGKSSPKLVITPINESKFWKISCKTKTSANRINKTKSPAKPILKEEGIVSPPKSVHFNGSDRVDGDTFATSQSCIETSEVGDDIRRKVRQARNQRKILPVGENESGQIELKVNLRGKSKFLVIDPNSSAAKITKKQGLKLTSELHSVSGEQYDMKPAATEKILPIDGATQATRNTGVKLHSSCHVESQQSVSQTRSDNSSVNKLTWFELRSQSRTDKSTDLSKEEVCEVEVEERSNEERIYEDPDRDEEDLNGIEEHKHECHLEDELSPQSAAMNGENVGSFTADRDEYVPASEASTDTQPSSPIKLPPINRKTPIKFKSPKKVQTIQVPEFSSPIKIPDMDAFLDSPQKDSEASDLAWDTKVDSFLNLVSETSAVIRPRLVSPRKPHRKSLQLLDNSDSINSNSFLVGSPKARKCYLSPAEKGKSPQKILLTPSGTASPCSRRQLIGGPCHSSTPCRPGDADTVINDENFTVFSCKSSQVDEPATWIHVDEEIQIRSPRKFSAAPVLDNKSHPQKSSSKAKKSLELVSELRKSPRKSTKSVGKKSVSALIPLVENSSSNTQYLKSKSLSSKLNSPESKLSDSDNHTLKYDKDKTSPPDGNSGHHVVPKLTPKTKLRLICSSARSPSSDSPSRCLKGEGSNQNHVVPRLTLKRKAALMASKSIGVNLDNSSYESPQKKTSTKRKRSDSTYMPPSKKRLLK